MNTTKKRLEELNHIITEHEKAILRSLQRCRYLTSGQVGRLHFDGHANKTAVLRAAQRTMVKLRDYGLAESLKRSIGGVRAGSGSYVWALSGAGVKLLSINGTESITRKRFFEPTSCFLQHTLAVSETYIRLTEISRLHGLELACVELEPESWREYRGDNGKSATLRPDLFAITDNGAYEYLYFIEVDLGTEAPSVVLAKCRRYTEYCMSSLKQNPNMILPLVVWLVPDAARRDNLKHRIKEYQKLPYKNLFALITPDELETLVANGAETLTEQKGA
jgi:hypothetical protein